MEAKAVKASMVYYQNSEAMAIVVIAMGRRGNVGSKLK